MTRVENFKEQFNALTATIVGEKVYKMLSGFAEILDATPKADIPNLDPALNTIWLCLGLKNGSTLQITDQIQELSLRHNVVTIHTSDRTNFIKPNAVTIFSLNDIINAQSLDVVEYQQRMATETAAHELEMGPQDTAQDTSETNELDKPEENIVTNEKDVKDTKETKPKTRKTKDESETK